MNTTVAVAVLSKKFIYSAMFTLSLIALAVDPIALGSAAVLVIGAISGAAVLIINALAKMKIDILEKTGELAEANDAGKKQLLERQAALLAKVDVVQGHVDGMTTMAAAKLTADENTILSLQRQLYDSEKRAELLAQSKTNIDLAMAIPPPPPQKPLE